MKNKILFVLFILCSVNLFAEKYIDKPRRNEVVIISKIIIKTDCDRDFYSKTLSVEDERDNPHIVQGKPCGEFIAITCNVGKNSKSVSLKNLTLYLFGNKKYFLSLPFEGKITFSSNAKYVYVGSFEYDFEGNLIDIKQIGMSDEFEDAEKWIREQLPKDNVTLYKASFK